MERAMGLEHRAILGIIGKIIAKGTENSKIKSLKVMYHFLCHQRKIGYPLGSVGYSHENTIQEKEVPQR
jgi:hypothetical protein